MRQTLVSVPLKDPHHARHDYRPTAAAARRRLSPRSTASTPHSAAPAASTPAATADAASAATRAATAPSAAPPGARQINSKDGNVVAERPQRPPRLVKLHAEAAYACSA